MPSCESSQQEGQGKMGGWMSKNGFINKFDMYQTTGGRGGSTFMYMKKNKRVALVRVPFYFINFLPPVHSYSRAARGTLLLLPLLLLVCEQFGVNNPSCSCSLL
jgi:hypothetical protein